MTKKYDNIIIPVNPYGVSIFNDPKQLQEGITKYLANITTTETKTDKEGNPITNINGETITINKYTEMPTIEGLAKSLKVSPATIKLYGKKEGYDLLINDLMSIQEEYIATGGLNNKLNSTMAIFLLKNNHGYKDKTETANINLNVSFDDLIKQVESEQEF